MDKIVVQPDYFVSRTQVVDELERNGMHIIEFNVPAVRNSPHWHRFTSWLYILEGKLNITDTKQGKSFQATPGSRVEVPERVLHSEESDGYQIIAGMTDMPEDLERVDLPPESLEKT